jgi:hypothetical protein
MTPQNKQTATPAIPLEPIKLMQRERELVSSYQSQISAAQKTIKDAESAAQALLSCVIERVGDISATYNLQNDPNTGETFLMPVNPVAPEPEKPASPTPKEKRK